LAQIAPSVEFVPSAHVSRIRSWVRPDQEVDEASEGGIPKMGIGVSIFLIAVGAVLAWAVNVQTSGVDLHAVGLILVVVGVIGVLLSMMFWSSWGGFHRETVYHD
jgi:hypothetical protein